MFRAFKARSSASSFSLTLSLLALATHILHRPSHLSSESIHQQPSHSARRPLCPPSSIPGLALYNWLFDILSRSPNPAILCTPAHSSSSLPARANSFVDHLASSPHAHSLTNPPISLPLPTFTSPDHVLHSLTVDSGVDSFLSSRAAMPLSSWSDISPNLPTLYDHHTPPLHPYTRTSSAYSAVGQLYASSQLDTASTRFSRCGDCTPGVRLLDARCGNYA